MRRALVALILAVAAQPVAAAVRCTGTPCIDSTGGVTSPIAGAFDVSGAWSWPSAGAANSVALGSTAGCIVFEGSVADANETLLCATEFADSTFNLPGSAVNAGTYTLLASNGGQVAYLSAFAVTADATTNAYILMGIGGYGMYKDAQLIWTSDAGTITGGAALTNKDAGMSRLGPGRLKITNGSTGAGGLQASQIVSPQITTYTTGADDAGTLFTSTGDADGSAITLMNDPTVGMWHDIAVTVAFTTTVQASAGEVLYGAAGTTCTTLTSNVVGSIMHVVATTAGSGALWMTQLNGTWVCTP